MAILPPKQIQGIRRVVLDLDDTLLDTTREYYKRIVKLAEDMSSRFSGRITTEEVVRLQEEIDVGELARHGFTRERFPISFVRTYENICTRFGMPVNPDVSRGVYRLGDSVYDDVPPMLPGVDEELGWLGSKYGLSLYTMGSQDVQSRKIETHQLGRYFVDIHIVLNKEPENLRNVCNGFNPTEVAVVGDSLRGEVQPAVTLGMHAVHVKRKGGWAYLDVPVNGDYYQIHQLSDLRHIL